MIRRLLWAVTVMMPLAVTAAAVPEGTSCVKLKALSIPDVTMNSAADIPAGAFVAPGSRNPVTLPAFCRIDGVITPTSDSEIKFEVWIPSSATWNGKFQGVGNG